VGRTLVRFCSVVFVALAQAPSLAHLLELPHKIRLSRDDYFTVQQIYRGWSLLGIVIFLALASTLSLAVASRRNRRALAWGVAAFLAVAATQAVFWAFTFPTNQATENWTKRPDDWEQLRVQWEYSHATGAGLTLFALVAVTLAALAPDPPGRRDAERPSVPDEEVRTRRDLLPRPPAAGSGEVVNPSEARRSAQHASPEPACFPTVDVHRRGRM
jgi:hypothetical protein